MDQAGQQNTIIVHYNWVKLVLDVGGTEKLEKGNLVPDAGTKAEILSKDGIERHQLDSSLEGCPWLHGQFEVGDLH